MEGGVEGTNTDKKMKGARDLNIKTGKIMLKKVESGGLLSNTIQEKYS